MNTIGGVSPFFCGIILIVIKVLSKSNHSGIIFTKQTKTKTMEKILNCLQHVLTPDQLASLAGFEIITLKDANPELFARVANTPSNIEELTVLAKDFVTEVNKYPKAILPIGSPAFQMLAGPSLTQYTNTEFWFSHSERSSVDETQPDGSVIKRQVFKHVDWIKI